jgi:FkbM family methyltransferase
MREVIEPIIKDTLHKFGIEISYISPDYKPDLYDTILSTAISVQSSFNIIQVGANDGKYNDPIYEFVKKYDNRTNIILIEPQEELIPYLKDNYSYHSSSEVYNKAIGSNESTIQLYRVRREYWDKIDIDYGDDWPDYRAPSGVTTSNREQLLNWVSEHIQTQLQPAEVIEGYNVDVIRPKSVLDYSEIIDEPHLLQVDTEGMDDEVIYNFFADGIYPGIINIESKHLTEGQKQNLDRILLSEGYKTYNYTTSEKLALKSKFDK